MNLELVNTYDGSNSLKNLIINDSYHSKYGAINESKHIFINNGLKRISKKKIRVLEIGFGTGLNALLTQLYCDKKEQNIIYHTIDNLPLKKDTYSSLNYCDQLKIDKDIFLKIHNSLWENEIELSNFFVLKKINCDFTKTLLNEKYELVLLDHNYLSSPKKLVEYQSKYFENDFNSIDIKNLKYFVVDCLRYTYHPSHFNLSYVLELTKKIKPKKTILTNLSVDIDYHDLKKKLPKNIIPAYDGLSFLI